MTRRAKLWWSVAALFAIVNVGGAVFAAVQGELPHAGGHVALLLVGAYVVSRLAARARPRGVSDGRGADERRERLEHLQQSVDAVAVEVERIGEAQRFSAKLESERKKTEL